MERLTDKGYWDIVHNRNEGGRKAPSLRSKAKVLIKRLLGQKVIGLMEPYSDYFLWNVIYRKYLCKKAGSRVLEIGSAPGNHLVRLQKELGLMPYGIEYSDSGAELNRRNFQENGIAPGNVIHADFFSEEFLNQYRESFDVVLSRGFIEHFTDVNGVIDKHLRLLKSGGRIVVIIPNFRGVNGLLLRLFQKNILLLHNTHIMAIAEFARLFEDKKLKKQYCSYYGAFNFGLFGVRKGSPLRFLLRFCNMLQAPMNILFRLSIGGRAHSNGLFCPYLIYIGEKI